MSAQIYIDTMKEQISSGMYDHLFRGKRDLVFLDVGANIGMVSVYAVPYCKRIVSVEPCLETFELLKAHTRNYPIISCDQRALAPEDGWVGFYINDINFTASSTVNTYGKYIPDYVIGAKLTTILKNWNLDHVDVCKIDAEGAEGESLGLDQLYAAKDIIKSYFIETHNCPKTTWEHKLGTLVGNLARCGYHNMLIAGMSITASRP